MLVVPAIGPPPRLLYVSAGLDPVLLGGGYWGADVVLFGKPYRMLDAEYISWLRVNARQCHRDHLEQFAALVREHCPQLLNAKVQVPFWYRPPSDDWPQWSDDEEQRVREASRTITPEMAEYKRQVLHGMWHYRKPNSDTETGDTRNRAKKPRASKVVAPMQRAPALPGMSLDEVRSDASREAIGL